MLPIKRKIKETKCTNSLFLTLVLCWDQFVFICLSCLRINGVIPLKKQVTKRL